MIDLKHIASAMGGEVHGNSVSFPTPGHSAKDRGTVATIIPGAPDGLLIHSFNGSDALAIKDDMRQRGLVPERERPSGGGWRVTGTYEFTDEAGAVLYRTRRHEHPAKPKRFTVERPDGLGGWIGKIGDARRVLYRLPELLAADPAQPIYLVEGERKADKLAAMGLTATAIAFGSKSWCKDYAEHLAGRTVAILPDNDKSGRKFANKARCDIRAAGGKAHLVDLPRLPEAGDIMDWTGSADDLRKLTDKAMAGKVHVPAFTRGISAAALMAKQFVPINFIVPGLLAEGATLFGGKPKIGKSWMAYDFALAIASGRPVFGSIPITQGDVLYLALEDSERRLKSRLLKKGVRNPPERLTLATEWPGLDNGCIAELEAWADSVERPSLVIVDVLKMVRGVTRANEFLYDADYRALTGLAMFARNRGIAVVIVHHVRKMEADDPLESLSGTNGLTGAADCVMVLKRDIGTGNCTLYVRGRDVEEAEKAVRFKRDIETHETGGASSRELDPLDLRGWETEQ